MYCYMIGIYIVNKHKFQQTYIILEFNSKIDLKHIQVNMSHGSIMRGSFKQDLNVAHITWIKLFKNGADIKMKFCLNWDKTQKDWSCLNVKESQRRGKLGADTFLKQVCSVNHELLYVMAYHPQGDLTCEPSVLLLSTAHHVVSTYSETYS